MTTCFRCRKSDIYCELANINGTIYLCLDCKKSQKEFEDKVINAMNENAKASDILANAKMIDASLRVQTDIFNAQTVTIHELRMAIDNDESITDKHFTLAKFLSERFVHLQDLITSARSSIIEAETKQRAIQTYYIELSKKLRQEQREQLKLKDLQYKPVEVKTVTPKKVSTKKADKEEAARVAKESGVPLQVLMLLALTKNLSYKDAALEFKKIESSVKANN